MFDRVVTTALESAPEAASLRPVVEKEILHHDILRELSGSGLLARLTFMGGTCLRACYGSPRLSEDLDFSTSIAERDLVAELGELGPLLTRTLMAKYDLPVRVSEPARDEANVHTWKVAVVTRLDRRDLPHQRIHIDVQALASHEPQPAVLRNPYRIDMGTSGLIVPAESLREILVDKLIALALRPNRLKNRDVWDILWLLQHDVSLSRELLDLKLSDRGVRLSDFAAAYAARCTELRDGHDGYMAELRRFLTPAVVTTLDQPGYWQYATRTTESIARLLGV